MKTIVKEHRIDFIGRRKEQQNAPHSRRTQVVNAESRYEAEEKIKQKFVIREIYE